MRTCLVIMGSYHELSLDALCFSPEPCVFLHPFLQVLDNMTDSRIGNSEHAPNVIILGCSPVPQGIYHGLAIEFSPANSSLDLQDRLIHNSRSGSLPNCAKHQDDFHSFRRSKGIRDTRVARKGLWWRVPILTKRGLSRKSWRGFTPFAKSQCFKVLVLIGYEAFPQRPPENPDR